MEQISSKMIDRALIMTALKDSFFKLKPTSEMRNPVMFVTYVGAILTTISFIIGLSKGAISIFELQISVWLWFTVIFANFAEALAEGRGKAQAESLKRTRTQLFARLFRDKREIRVAATELRKSDVVICEANDIIPADGDVIEGIASDQIGDHRESAPVIRESGGDRSAVTVLSKSAIAY